METKNQSLLPTTIESAVRLLVGMVPESEQAKIATLPETGLAELHFDLGQWLRNNLGLWEVDSVLLKATGQSNADDACGVIIHAFWQKLQDGRPRFH